MDHDTSDSDDDEEGDEAAVELVAAAGVGVVAAAESGAETPIDGRRGDESESVRESRARGPSVPGSDSLHKLLKSAVGCTYDGIRERGAGEGGASDH